MMGDGDDADDEMMRMIACKDVHERESKPNRVL